MRTTARWPLAALVFMLGITLHVTPAAAKLELARCSTHQPARAELACGRRDARLGHQALRFLRRDRDAGDARSRRAVRRSARYLVRYGTRHVRLAQRRLGPAHLTGWRCITHGANFDDSGHHEGNGYNGSYSGPLGMTTPWLGNYPPGRDWVHSPVMAVYAIAERVAAANGFSYSFMRGQWPLTFPPCAGYFD